MLLLLLACTPRPDGAPTINGDPDNTWPALPDLDENLVQIMEQDGIAGLSACMIIEGETRWCGGYGDRDPDQGLPAYPSTPFLLASVSKSVAAVADMMAVEDGLLDLDAPINDTLDFTVTHPDDPATPITLRRLMTHTSGIADNWNIMDAHYVDGDSPEPLGAFLESYLTPGGDDYRALNNFYPDGVGGIAEYSNIGAALGAYMVEAATDTPFDRYCEERIFAPLNMTGGWFLSDVDLDEVAVPTLLEGGEWVTVPHFGVPDYPDGQLRTDAHSMARFLSMMDNGGIFEGTRLLTEESVDQMLTPQYNNLDDTQGLIWYWWTLDGADVWGHNGGETGTSTEILMREEDGLGTVVLMNSEGKNATLEKVERAILAAAEEL
jgi:CubicO group peptidase (beta-lactamase class C family)